MTNFVVTRNPPFYYYFFFLHVTRYLGFFQRGRLKIINNFVTYESYFVSKRVSPWDSSSDKTLILPCYSIFKIFRYLRQKSLKSSYIIKLRYCEDDSLMINLFLLRIKLNIKRYGWHKNAYWSKNHFLLKMFVHQKSSFMDQSVGRRTFFNDLRSFFLLIKIYFISGVNFAQWSICKIHTPYTPTTFSSTHFILSHVHFYFIEWDSVTISLHHLYYHYHHHFTTLP